jgi:hypothetical protein
VLILSTGQTARFEFIFNINQNFYDPTLSATPSDVSVSVYRGDLGAGAVIDGPYSYFNQDETELGNRILKEENSIIYYGDYDGNPGETTSELNATKFVFVYTIPNNLFPGNYSVVATTYLDGQLFQYTAQFQVPQSSSAISDAFASGQKELTKSFVPAFETLEQYKTNSVVLIGHADGIPLNTVIRINSVQTAIDLLKADFNSPLLRGVFDCYASGGRDIYICAAAPMSEYVEGVNERLEAKPTYALQDATPLFMNFYQRYYDRLEETYNILKELDYMDIVVPLEVSFINSGGVDFVTQLALYCEDFHNLSSCIQIGIIGTRNSGIKEEDIQTLEDSEIFTEKYTMLDPSNQIIGDMGRFVVPIYGELIMNHSFLNISYTSSGSAIMAGMISANPVNQSLIRKKVTSAFGLSGITMNQSQVDRLDAVGVNSFTKGSRSRRGNNYEVYVTNDHTMASKNSNYRKAPQIRLVSMVINEIKALTSNTISKFSGQKAVDDVRSMLSFLKNNGIILDYTLEAFFDSFEKGKMYFDISLVSTLGMRKISFSISAGQAA